MSNRWLEFVQLYREKNAHLSYQEAIQQAKVPYHQLKKQFQKKRGGGGIDLSDPQMRFEAGVSALNSNLKEIGRPVIYGGSGIDLSDPQMRFEAGVSALNSNLKEIGRPVIYGGRK